MRRIFTIFAITFVATICSFASAQNVVWHNPAESKADIIKGRAFGDQTKDYGRLPMGTKSVVRDDVWRLAQNSAGLSIEFTTNSKNIYVRYAVSGGYAMEHMPSTGVSGVDLYMFNEHGKSNWCRGFYNFKDTIQYSFKEIKYSNGHQQGSEFELFLPLYNTVKWLEIGVDDGAKIEFYEVSKERPIVVYGTSIAQGACASRPGMAWTNILSRQLETPIINLGFSGNGQLEKELFDIIGDIKSKLIIVDCIPNMTGGRIDLIYDRTIDGAKNLRGKTDVPILLVEHCGYMNDGVSQGAFDDVKNANDQLLRAYNKLIADGVKGIYYMTKAQLGLSMDSQVDGVHATDLGMQQMADGYAELVKQILNTPSGELTTQKPVRQDRDAESYNWRKRHQKTLQFNQANKPEILCIGNSITHFWGEQIMPNRATGVKVWNKMFAGKTVSNMGSGWDKVENVLWRVYHDELYGFDAKKIFILIGCNNLYDTKVEDIASGLEFLVDAIKVRQPKAKVHVMTILPRVGVMDKIIALNELLRERLPHHGVEIVEIGNELLNTDGSVNESMYTDGTHPTEQGYSVIAPSLIKFIK